MMVSARAELAEAIGGLEEREAELVLSFLHALRAHDIEARSTDEGSRRVDPGLWLMLLHAMGADRAARARLAAAIEQLAGRADPTSALLTQELLARDWARPEEDEAWADL